MSKIKRFLRFVKNSLKKKKFYSVVNYDITSRCNLRCEHCYWWKIRASKELSDKEWEKVFKEHVKKGAQMGYLTGGEPTLRMNVVKMAYKIFPSIGIVSNGTMKIPEDIQCRIYVSLDGPAELHNKIRGKKVFDKIMKNVKNDKRIILAPTLSTTNYKYIDEMVEIARKSGVEAVTFSVYTSHKKSGDPLLLTGEKLDWTVSKLTQVWKKNKDFVWLTPRMIKLFKTKKHIDDCYFRKDWGFVAFDSQMHQKHPCTMGKGINCKSCGCIIPVMSHALKRADVRAWFLFDKYYPEKYYRH